MSQEMDYTAKVSRFEFLREDEVAERRGLSTDVR